MTVKVEKKSKIENRITTPPIVKKMSLVAWILLFTSLRAIPVKAVNNGLARTPPLGWVSEIIPKILRRYTKSGYCQMFQNNWYSTYCDVSEDLVLDTSQLLIDTGLRDLGYQYVVLDDCWAEDERDETGHWRADLTKFPNGMKYVADTLHEKGLLFGMYSSAGELTCAGYRKSSTANVGYDGQLMARTAGSLDHEKEDAEDLAAWNVDYFKYDNCYNLGRSGTALISFNRYKAMGDALNATGRPMVYSLCSWGEDQVHTVCGTCFLFPISFLLY
jgi:alpha-galactosidase